MTATKTETGSQLVAALEGAWSAIRARHPEVPDVVIITGGGAGPSSIKWGHFGREFWTNGRFRVNSAGEVERDRKHELFVSGETLGVGAAKTIQTLLHEATHALAAVREVKDTSRQGRYHNAKFRELAEELGLAYAADKPCPKQGFSAVTITDEARKAYDDVIRELDAAIALTMELPSWARLAGLGGTTGGAVLGGGGDGDDGEEKPKTGLVKAVCSCDEPNIIRVSRKVLATTTIRCDTCECAFLPPGEA